MPRGTGVGPSLVITHVPTGHTQAPQGITMHPLPPMTIGGTTRGRGRGSSWGGYPFPLTLQPPPRRKSDPDIIRPRLVLERGGGLRSKGLCTRNGRKLFPLLQNLIFPLRSLLTDPRGGGGSEKGRRHGGGGGAARAKSNSRWQISLRAISRKPRKFCGHSPKCCVVWGVSRLGGAEPQVPASRKPLDFVCEISRPI